jgi:hypothetical protein
MKKNIISLILICSLVFTGNLVAFAGETVVEKPILSGTDTFIQLDDFGAKEIISNIQDKNSKEKIAQYWYTPAYETSCIKEATVDAERLAKKDQAIEILIELSSLSGSKLDNRIKNLIQGAITTVLADESLVPSNDLIVYAIKNKCDNIDKLNQAALTRKVATDKKTSAAEQSAALNSDMGILTVTSGTTTAQTYTYSTSGIMMYFLKCVVKWNYDTATNKISSLTPTTTYGSDGIINFNSGLIQNVQDIRSISGIDVGRVQKCVGIYNAATPAYQGFSWWLVADVNVKGNGVVSFKKQAAMSYMTYSVYTWS